MPLRKYLVSSFDIAKRVFSINFKKIWESIENSKFNFPISIIGNSSFGRHPKENLYFPDLIENILPSFDINSTSLPSGNFLTIS